MKINISPEIILKISKNPGSFNVKILNTGFKSSVIIINNIKIDIPFKLNKNSVYSAKIKDNKIELFEKNKNNNVQLKEIKNEETDNFFERIYDQKDEKNIVFDFLGNLNPLNINRDKFRRKYLKQNFLMNQEGYNFFFNLPFFESDAKFYIFIDQKNINISVFSGLINKKHQDKFKENLNDLKKSESRELNVHFFKNNCDFYENIKNKLRMKTIDIDI